MNFRYPNNDEAVARRIAARVRILNVPIRPSAFWPVVLELAALFGRVPDDGQLLAALEVFEDRAPRDFASDDDRFESARHLISVPRLR